MQMLNFTAQFHTPAAVTKDNQTNILNMKTSPWVRWIGGWVVSKAGVDVTEERKNSYLYRDSNLGRSVTKLTELSRLLLAYIFARHGNYVSSNLILI
jgi:hypothetical protein